MFIDILMVVLFICLVFVPTVIAFKRNLKHRWACFLIDLLFGWIFFVWVPLIIWSVLTNTVDTD